MFEDIGIKRFGSDSSTAFSQAIKDDLIALYDRVGDVASERSLERRLSSGKSKLKCKFQSKKIQMDVLTLPMGITR